MSERRSILTPMYLQLVRELHGVECLQDSEVGHTRHESLGLVGLQVSDEVPHYIVGHLWRFVDQLLGLRRFGSRFNGRDRNRNLQVYLEGDKLTSWWVRGRRRAT